jgi:protein-disulfide isomerase
MKDKVIPILVIVLIIFAFFSGSLWTKVRQLEKVNNPPAGGEGLEEGREGEIQEQAPEEVQVLGAEDQAEIIKNAGAVKGAEDAKVTMVEFSEYQCPYCKRYVEGAYKQIMENYGRQIRYIFRDYPLPFHQQAQMTAEAARCAGEQGKYWEYHDKLFDEQEKWINQENVQEVLVSLATSLGLNQSQFRDCLTSGKFTQAVKDDFVLGQKVGVQGTPSFFINGQMLVGAQPYSVFEAVIKEELNK